jgi:hypothetical protein
MKTLCLIGLLLAWCLPVFGQSQGPTNNPASVTLAWDLESATNHVAFYKVYWGSATATYTNSLSASTNLSLTISNLTRGSTYYFAATATGTNGLESAYSTELSWTAPTPPLPPTTFRIVTSN